MVFESTPYEVTGANGIADASDSEAVTAGSSSAVAVPRTVSG